MPVEREMVKEVIRDVRSGIGWVRDGDDNCLIFLLSLWKYSFIIFDSSVVPERIFVLFSILTPH